MRIIDETPFQNSKGKIGLFDRLRGSLQFGGSWYPELEAQKVIVPHLAKQLERGYTLIRNHVLGRSGIVVPLILVGSAGVYAIYVTPQRGVFVANGEFWGIIDRDRVRPERVNLLTRTARLGRALQAYLQRQGLRDFGTVEAVLVAAYPGMQIESVRPMIRVVMSDAIDYFVGSLLQAGPNLSNQAAHDVVERILHPHSRQAPQPKEEQEVEVPPPSPLEIPPFKSETGSAQGQSKEAAWDPSELGFAFEDESEIPTVQLEPGTQRTAEGQVTQPVANQQTQPKPPPRPLDAIQDKPRRRINGLQCVFLVCLGLLEVCILVAFAALILYPSLLSLIFP
jgi:hypothetical protein